MIEEIEIIAFDDHMRIVKKQIKTNNMNKEELLTLVQKEADRLGFTDVDKIQPSSPLGQTYLEGNDTEPIGMDSLDITELSLNMEKATNKGIDDKELQKVKTVEDIINHFVE